MRERIRITQIRARDGRITKVLNGKRSEYVVPVVYVLEDGLEIPTEERFSLLREAKEFQAGLPESPR